MVATDRHFNLYEYVPAAPSLDALRKQHHVRGFGYLGIRVQSSQGEMLRQHTRLLRNQVEVRASHIATGHVNQDARPEGIGGLLRFITPETLDSSYSAPLTDEPVGMPTKNRSRPSHVLTQDLNSMLKEMEVPDSALFLGLTSEEHLFDDDIATAAFKAVITTVQ
ncbi:hypothetical protein V5799_027871 [Amblyomma americanum]|uniref:Uncharacterized protein n=1 Tax=Amblyomma americanum TaxID=6943 RepID=A0AAQ4DEH2_AMBAM